MKKWIKSLLCLSLCGTVGFAAGCDLLSPVTLGNSKKEEEQRVARAGIYTAAGAFLATMLSSGNTYALTLSLEGEITEEDATKNEAGEWVPIVDTFTMDVEGSLYFQNKGKEALSVDATISGQATVEESPFIYGALYLRNTDLYMGGLNADTEITDAQKDAVVYTKESLGDIFGEVAGGTESALPKEAEALIQKVLNNVLSGISGTIEKKGDVKTLTVDLKAEIEAIAAVAEEIIDGMKATTTIKELLGNKALKKAFNKYLGTVSAQEIKTVLDLFVAKFGMFAEPKEGMSGYDYLVDTIVNFPNGDGTKLGDQAIGAEALAEIKEGFAELKTGILAMIKELRFTLTLKGDALSSISVAIDIKEAVDAFKLNLSLGFAGVEGYVFKDVSGLTVEQETDDTVVLPAA